MKKIVIDTNILVSAAIGKGSSSIILSEIIFNNTIEVYITREILNEYERVSNYNRIQKKKPAFKEKMKDMIEVLEEIGVRYVPKKFFTIIKDVSDNIFLDAAYEANAHYLITGNHKDFTITEFEQTKILNPKTFCDLYEQNKL